MSFPAKPVVASDAESARPTWRRRFASASLRRQLLVSHVGLVAIAVLLFGVALAWSIARGVYRQAEADLLAAAQLMLRELAEGASPDSLEVTQTYVHRFGPAPRDRAYIALWDARGRQVYTSGGLPAEAIPADASPPTHGPRPFLARSYGTHLDVIVATPSGGQLLIGRPLAKEFDGMWRLLAQIALIALGCAALAALGAWWIAERLARPLIQMTNEAERIDGRSLGTRLDTAAAPSEITRLAAVFNAMLARLQAAFERQARFTADASHELRTPVSIVLSQAEHTLSRDRTPEEYREALATCQRASQRMGHLIDDLLVLARADAGQLTLRRTPVDLSSIVRNTVEPLGPLAVERRVRIETHLQPAVVYGDADRLAQVVTNLVVNALHYNVPDGYCSIDVQAGTTAVTLVVRDGGRGIAAEALPHLFERFYRVDAARTFDRTEGVGLGLSLVAEIVAAHGGTISVESQLGRGTTFVMQLPATRSEEWRRE